MTYFEDGSRSCLRCGALVPDPSRPTHVEFHERVDPAPAPTPEPVPEIPEEITP